MNHPSDKIAKACGNCGVGYTLKQFKKLLAPQAGELQDLFPEDGDPVRYLLYRNCPCTATLVISLNDDKEFIPPVCSLCKEETPRTEDFNGCICCPVCYATLRKESKIL